MSTTRGGDTGPTDREFELYLRALDVFHEQRVLYWSRNNTFITLLGIIATALILLRFAAPDRLGVLLVAGFGVTGLLVSLLWLSISISGTNMVTRWCHIIDAMETSLSTNYDGTPASDGGVVEGPTGSIDPSAARYLFQRYDEITGRDCDGIRLGLDVACGSSRREQLLPLVGRFARSLPSRFRDRVASRTRSGSTRDDCPSGTCDPCPDDPADGTGARATDRAGGTHEHPFGYYQLAGQRLPHDVLMPVLAAAFWTLILVFWVGLDAPGDYQLLARLVAQ